MADQQSCQSASTPVAPLNERRAGALATITRHINGETQTRTDIAGALVALCSEFGISLCDGDCCDEPLSLSSDLVCLPGDLDEARSRVHCGQIDDALHFLERALPEGYGIIAERIASHVRTRS